MRKTLMFEIKQNLKKPPRVYIRNRESRNIIGTFPFDNPSEFCNWSTLSNEQKIEIQQFIQNIQAIYPHCNSETGFSTEDFRLRIPSHIINALVELSNLCADENIEIDVYQPIIRSFIQQIKVATNKLSVEGKYKANIALARAGLGGFKKIDLNQQNQTIFSELIKIINKSERLYQKALDLFKKDKSFSPKSIENMAKGDMIPQKWLVSCAIEILMDEKVNLLDFLSCDDLFMLWAKPQLDNRIPTDQVLAKAVYFDSDYVYKQIEEYSTLKSKLQNQNGR